MKPNPRPFTLGDLMAMIAVVAFGFALTRWLEAPIDPALTKGLKQVAFSGGGATTWLDVPWHGRPANYVLVLTLAMIPLRWKSPRPRAARVLRQPGAVACLAIVGAGAVQLAMTLYEHAIERRDPIQPHFYQNSSLLWDLEWYIPVAVAAAWAALLLGRCWEPERSWVDRIGRALGWYWLAWLPIRYLPAPLSAWLPYLQTGPYGYF